MEIIWPQDLGTVLLVYEEFPVDNVKKSLKVTLVEFHVLFFLPTKRFWLLDLLIILLLFEGLIVEFVVEFLEDMKTLFYV